MMTCSMTSDELLPERAHDPPTTFRLFEAPFAVPVFEAPLTVLGETCLRQPLYSRPAAPALRTQSAHGAASTCRRKTSRLPEAPRQNTSASMSGTLPEPFQTWFTA